MFLKSEENDRRPDKKKYRFDPVKVLIGMAVGYIVPEIALYLSDNIYSNETLTNIGNVSSIGLAVIFGIIMLFVTFRVDFIYDDEEKEKVEHQNVQNEITAQLAAYQEAKENGNRVRMSEIEEWLKERKVTIKK